MDRLSLRGPGSAQDEQHYRYDALGRLSFRSSGQGSSSPIIAYTYDPAGRLIASQHGDRAHRYPVDAAGNRLNAQPGEPTRPNAANQLSELDGSRYRFDGAGNLIEREASNGERLSLGYDGANRLVRLIRTSAQGATEEARYRYDALGRRISKTVHHANGTTATTATTHYGWDGDRLVHEAKENQRTTVVYEPGSFVPMLRVDQAGPDAPKQISAYITDALGTPMQLVTPRGDTLWQAQPDDWAAVTNEQGRTAQPIRFQGQWHDEESGLYYNRHRYYDPQQGRYISQDPIGLKGGRNLYGYVSNPTGMVDPLGLEGMHSCQSHENLRITAEQQQLADVGNVQGFWESRLEMGDPVARAGLASLNPSGGVADYLFGGTSINNRLEAFSRVYAGTSIDIDSVRLDLMNAHIDAVNNDTAGVLGLLNPQQIAVYHHEVFAEYGLPSTAFGGTPLTGSVWEADATRVVWCGGCDWK
ncbi:RHS repeat-associated core domain-containing protein [Billgrantia sp. C5P2]|uniref:RHS repeat-associated core domain-containing protein n=1 Tax=Billgrantia sp. C5P2 TaxID=3436239 RepID=UPI003DA540C2